MAWNPPQGGDEYATKKDLERYATKEDLLQGLQSLRTELMDFIREHCVSKADLERMTQHFATKADLGHMGRVYAWGIVGAMGVMLAATLAGMWGVVHTLVSLAD